MIGKVGIKYCGHCMPLQSMYDLGDELAELAPGIGFVPFFRDPDVDLLLILCACPAECVSARFGGPVMMVSPGYIDHEKVDPDSMAEEILRRLTSEERESK